MPRRKKGAGLNEHVENYIEEEEDFRPDQKLLDRAHLLYFCSSYKIFILSVYSSKLVILVKMC